MGFDISATLQSMESAVKTTVTGAWPQAQQIWASFEQTNKNILADMAQATITGQMSKADLQSYLDDMKTTLQTQLLASEVMALAVAQAAANAALDVFWAAVNAAIPTI
ncbi:hypothetical protein BEL04_22130 [Mucilaginibacter sp. PPCGB 2223]|uniref:hypothetical protein n=1 Tax=Mucilaginibacter sp. PPCGB 2223 TaxID=1886027 RepID=UPI000826CE27|nr:hypothetical protein [Mucilaginibacter sp. PPCGB 2223]OCX50482.1 hypothetical protein BEL04_22130 [Mucilaginibacter sp. PPCGB 2223]